MTRTIAAYCCGIALLLCFSAFFSGSEIAFSAASGARLEASRDGSAKHALYIKNNFDRTLSAILIGNNLVNISSSSVATLLALIVVGENASPARQDLASTTASIAMTALVLIFGETMPKIIARRDPNRFALTVAAPLRAFMTILTPVTSVITGAVNLLTSPLKGESIDRDEEARVAREELIDLIETSEDEGIIGEDESELLQNALDFSEISVQEIMTPRVDMTAIGIGDDPRRQKRVIENSPFSRLPVYDERRENIIGVLHLNRYYRALLEDGETDLESLLIKPCFVYKTVRLPAVLSLMRQRKTHIAVVTDEYGGNIGMVTMEDVLEQIVGDIWGEDDDPRQEIEEVGDGQYRLDGDLSVSEFCDLLGWNEDDFETDSVTVGGWTIESFGAFPSEGESFDFRNINVKVLRMDNHRVDKLLVTVKKEEPEE